MNDTIAILNNALSIGLDTLSVKAIAQLYQNTDLWYVDALKKALPVFAGALIGLIPSYFTYKFSIKQKKIETYCGSLEKEITLHKDFRRDFLLIENRIKLAVNEIQDDSENYESEYAYIIISNLELYKKLLDKWIGLIDDQIIKVIKKLISVINDLNSKIALEESQQKTEPTMDQKIEYRNNTIRKLRTSFITSFESVNEVTKSHIDKLRNKMK
jgi:hypothetical protein